MAATGKMRVCELSKVLAATPAPKDHTNRVDVNVLAKSLIEVEFGKLRSKQDLLTILSKVEDHMLAEADEIVPHVFVGNFKAANDASFLRSKGITHVLNVAHADKREAGCYIVDPDKIDGIQYHGIYMEDTIEATDLWQIENFLRAVELIDTIVTKEGGSVAVCCFAGYSRSASSVIAYLMLKRGLSAVEAIAAVKSKRNVQPSNEFLVLLATMHNHAVCGTTMAESLPDDGKSVVMDGLRRNMKDVMQTDHRSRS